ncbi:DUF1283 family protein [Affinibrenneria salicis]|uniref:UPF0482 protein FJU30_06165 n=1 Tax=Affinibrenneria salicis TaxID=2590031 RepID=A0A5J5G484_9GAMM|nr:DUF1283 family protein [Affinibrenneria salicis]KAA9001871.1 DUF1283 family protein [Affinibrenneria salicis]
MNQKVLTSPAVTSWLRALLPAAVLTLSGVWLAGANADTRHVVIESGDSSLSKEAARQSSEQWNESRTLRQKVNTRSEKEFDKLDKAIDNQETCAKSLNVNAYWEANTERCLDRRTGRQIDAP